MPKPLWRRRGNRGSRPERRGGAILTPARSCGAPHALLLPEAEMREIPSEASLGHWLSPRHPLVPRDFNTLCRKDLAAILITGPRSPERPPKRRSSARSRPGDSPWRDISIANGDTAGQQKKSQKCLDKPPGPWYRIRVNSGWSCVEEFTRTARPAIRASSGRREQGGVDGEIILSSDAAGVSTGHVFEATGVRTAQRR